MFALVVVARVEEPGLLLESSEASAAPPVLARLCFGCSESEGERDLLRVESASGMVKFQ